MEDFGKFGFLPRVDGLRELRIFISSRARWSDSQNSLFSSRWDCHFRHFSPACGRFRKFRFCSPFQMTRFVVFHCKFIVIYNKTGWEKILSRARWPTEKTDFFGFSSMSLTRTLGSVRKVWFSCFRHHPVMHSGSSAFPPARWVTWKTRFLLSRAHVERLRKLRFCSALISSRLSPMGDSMTFIMTSKKI